MRILMTEIMQWVFLVCALFCTLRLILGPKAADRLAALNVLSGVVLAILVLRGTEQARALYLDVALVYDIFGFLGFLALAYLLKGRFPGGGKG